MTDQERDPLAADGAEATTDQPATADAEAEAIETAEPGEADEAEADDEDELEDEVAPDASDAPVAGAAAAAAVGTSRRSKGQPARKMAAAPSVSQQAVRVDDRASAIFVIAIVGVFVAIFVLGLLVGPGGLFGNVLKGASTPAPAIEVTAAPPESVAPSASPVASPSASAVPSASPSASPSAEASPSPSAS